MSIEELIAACEVARPDLKWSGEDGGEGYFRLAGLESGDSERRAVVTVRYDSHSRLTLIVLDGVHCHHTLTDPADLQVYLRPPRRTPTRPPPSLRDRHRRRKPPAPYPSKRFP